MNITLASYKERTLLTGAKNRRPVGSRRQMLGLPSIKALNDEARKRATSARPFEWYANNLVDPDTGERAQCLYHSPDCKGPLRGMLWYDIFSDDPKGVLFLCDFHNGRYGVPAEGYFYCEGCDRVFIESYAREIYAHYADGAVLCLNCWAKAVIGDESQWTDISNKDGIELVSLEDVAPRIFAVGGPRHGLMHIGSVTVGSYDRAQAPDSDAADGAERAIRGLLHQAHDKGYTKALIVCEGANHPTTSLGVYVKP